jgi:hypothetical protein
VRSVERLHLGDDAHHADSAERTAFRGIGGSDVEGDVRDIGGDRLRGRRGEQGSGGVSRDAVYEVLGDG